MKRYLSMLLAVIMLVSGFALPTFAAEKEVAEVGAPTQAEAVEWLNAQVGKSLDYDGAYGAQCVDLIKYYYNLFGCAKYAIGDGCDYATNTLPPGWTRIQGGTPQTGDVLVWTGGPSGDGHVAVYGGGNNYFHQNWSGQYVEIITKSYTTGITYKAGGFAPYWGVIRPQFGNHTTHSYDTYVYYWASHPHYKCYKCSCGEIKENRDEPTYIDSCAQCRVGKTTVHSDKKVYYTGERVELTWDTASNATHYNFYLMKKDSSGEYNTKIEWINNLKQTSYCYDGLPDGDYMIELYSYDSNHWETDGSDWCHEMADLIYFTVSKDTKINQHIGMFYNNSRYELYNATMSWKDAKSYCEKQGGHLVTITSQGEMDIVRELVSQGGRWCYYMGITDEDSEGNWKNITGEPINYTNWINGEPNNENAIEHYGVVRNIDGNNWNDVVNVYKNNPVGFICEYEFEEPTIMLGDTDGDGKVTIKDATTIQKHVAGITTISDEKFACADTDKDGKISVKDATRIQKFLAGIISSL